MSTDLEDVLRTGLQSTARALPVHSDPWPGFAQREKRHRNRRTRRLAGVAAAVVAVTGVQLDVVPLPGWAPSVAVASQHELLAKGPTRGSLAGDTAWLAEMRKQFSDISEAEGVWKVGDRKKIKFVYAGDVAGRRVVVAIVPLTFGILTAPTLTLHEGPVGAAPDTMREAGRGDSDSVVTYATGDDTKPGFAIVIGPVGSSVSISTGATYSAGGRVERSPAVVSEPGTGVGAVTLKPSVAPSITAKVVQGGKTLFDGATDISWQTAEDPYQPSDATITAALRGTSFDRTTLKQWVSSALSDAHLPAKGTTVGLRWTGKVNNKPAALFTLRQPGSGVLAYAMHGDAGSWRTDLRLLLPAAGADTRPLAWRMLADGKDHRTEQVTVAAPGAARVELTARGAAPVAVKLDASGAGTATVGTTSAASVTSYAADGRTIGTTPVPAFGTSSGGIPGDDPLTRIVP